MLRSGGLAMNKASAAASDFGGQTTLLRNLLRRGLALFAAFVCLVIVYISMQSVYGARLDYLEWQRPRALWLLALLPLLYAVIFFFRRERRPALRVSVTHELKKRATGLRTYFSFLPDLFRMLALALCIVALAVPVSLTEKGAAELEGIDIVLALDMSESMKDRDIVPDRFRATQAVVDDFVSRRPNDRIGVVVFGTEAYTLLPLTTDKTAIRNEIARLQLGAIDGTSTAIGNAVATSLNRLRKSKAKSRVIILLTDGSSNAGDVFPEQAVSLARSLEVPVFSILMGATRDLRRFGQSSPVDPELLKKMSARSKGKYYAVTDRRGLKKTFHEILDRLERAQLEENGKIYTKLYPALLWPALILLMLELLMRRVVMRRWP